MFDNAFAKKIRQIYFSFGHICCAALDDKPVIFDHRGWNHIFNGGHTAEDIMRRLRLIPHVPSILTDKTSIIGCRLSGSYREWSVEKTIGDKKVVVIIGQIKDKQPYFLSVMNRKTKSLS